MRRRDVAFDLLVLPLLVVVHCAIVFTLLCLYIFGWDYVSYTPAIGRDVPYGVVMIMSFGVPLGLAIVAAWFNSRFIIGKIARTDGVRTISAIAIFLFAFAVPVFMFPVDIVIGCMVTSEKVGKSICL